jgi:hypothetical protein
MRYTYQSVDSENCVGVYSVYGTCLEDLFVVMFTVHVHVHILFSGWLKGVPGQPTRAYCSFCEKSLHAHRLSLLKHTCTLKHTKAAQKNFAQKVVVLLFFYFKINGEECWLSKL